MSRFFYAIPLLLYFSLFLTYPCSSQVLDYRTEINVDDNQVKTTIKTIRFQINSKDENGLSHIQIPHSSKQNFTLLYAKIFDTQNNELRKLKKKEVTSRNYKTNSVFHQDNEITEFDLYWNEYPYQVEYSYEIKEAEFIYITHWSPLLFKGIDSKNANLIVTIPKGYEVNYNNTSSYTFSQEELENGDRLTWAIQNSHHIEPEIYGPAQDELYESVVIVPNNFKYGIKGSNQSWSSFGDWIMRLNKNTDILPKEEVNQIKELVNGITDTTEIIRTLYHKLQDETKYVNVAIDIGGLKSYPASFVSKTKYGDCKALTTYMKSMLNGLGIKSYYTLVNAGSKVSSIDTSLPGQQFNHVILMVPQAKDTIWLENTSKSAPFNQPNDFTQNRYGLIVDGTDSRLVQLPRLTLDDVLVRKDLTIENSDSKNNNFQATLTLKGADYDHLNYLNKKGDEKSIVINLKRNLGFKNIVISDWTIKESHRDNPSIQAIVSGTSKDIVREIGNMTVLANLLIEIPDFNRPNKRKSPVVFYYPLNEKHTITFKGFEDISKVDLPQNINIKSPFGHYTVSHEIRDNSLVSQEHLLLFTQTIALENYSDFYDFIEKINDYKTNAKIVFQ